MIIYNKICQKVVFLVMMLLCAYTVRAADQKNYDRKLLNELLEQRHKKFASYATSIEKHSGIFGNKTRKDMQQSNAVLTEIVKTDNQIISVLNRAVDFKNYEKVTMNYDARENADQLRNLIQATDTLTKQVGALKQLNNSLKIKFHSYKIATWIFALTALALLILLFKEKRKTKYSHN